MPAGNITPCGIYGPEELALGVPEEDGGREIAAARPQILGDLVWAKAGRSEVREVRCTIGTRRERRIVDEIPRRSSNHGEFLAGIGVMPTKIDGRIGTVMVEVVQGVIETVG